MQESDSNELIQTQASVRQLPEKSDRKLVYLSLLLALALVVAAFFSGVKWGSNSVQAENLEASIFSIFSPAPVNDEEVNLNEFWEVWDILDDKFVSASSTNEISEQTRVWGAVNGLVNSYGDPYTTFFPPKDASRFEEDISGNFGGVGMEVGMRDDVLTIISPLPNTPAERAGLVSGDKIIEIDGQSTQNMNINESVNLIRGEIGTEVMLTIYREGEEEFLEIPVVREEITIPTVETEQLEDAFVISLYSFNALSEQKIQEALRDYVESGSNNLILDLRGNPGGYLRSAINIAGYFLPPGKVVVREDFGDGNEEVYRSQGRTLQQYTPDKMVVLVDEGSASASEILAGALSEHGVATLIGETTFGKGSVQELVTLPSGSSLKVTIARWLTPDGKSISQGGLKPDIEVIRTTEEVLAGEDPQIQAAIDFINE